MRIHSPLFLLAAVGALCGPLAAWAAPDTSAWKCKSCPFPSGTTASVDVGLGAVDEESARFADLTGLDNKGAHLVLGGTLSARTESGYFADLEASDLGLDTRRLAVTSGRQGLYSLRLGYAELPRHFAFGAVTPFAGSGGDTLTLPANFASGSTASMPLVANQQLVDVGYKKSRLDLSATLVALQDWTVRVALKRDVRDGTRATYGAFQAAASQLVMPVDQVTDQLEVSAIYATRQVQGSLAYSVSRFDGGPAALTWDSPFLPVVTGATRGQLALAPDNQLHQLTGSAGYAITPTVRASADFTIGRLTQNEAYLAPTLNAALGTVARPASSLDGRVDTFNGSVKLTAAPMADLRLSASYAHDERANKTGSLAYPLVTTDLFVAAATRNNTPFDIKQDRFKLSADYRGLEMVTISGGADQDNRERTYHEAVKTRETTVWTRLSLQPLEELSLALKLAHAERKHSDYGTAIWFGAPENPLLRKLNLAERKRDTAGVRADYAVNEQVGIGLNVDFANDDYGDAVIGLNDGRSASVGADVSVAFSEQTRLTVFAQSERMRSSQAGSQAFAAPDWTAQIKDQFDMLGAGIKHTVTAGKFDVGADLSVARSKSDTLVDTVFNAPPYPSAKTSQDTFKVYANYKLRDDLWVNGSFWHERYTSQDWRLDGVAPATVANLLSLGAQPPQYNVNVVRVSLRYRF